MDSQSCTKIAGLVLVFTIIYFFYQSSVIEKYANFTSFDQYLPNRNGFKNYYRVGYEQSENMGWKPSETWDHLRPEYNECPECFHKDRIY